MGETGEKRSVKITCQGAAVLPLDAFEPFQGSLKTLSVPDYKRLRAALETHGIAFPVFVWRHGIRQIVLDGHQRILTLKKMRDEGWTIPPIPVAWVEAKDIKDAKKKVLLATSQYGKISDEGLYEFLNSADLVFDEMKDFISLPDFNIDKFEAGWTGRQPTLAREDDGGTDFCKCPKCGHRFKR